MTIKQIADACGVKKYGDTSIYNHNTHFQPVYTESDIEKMLRYVAMEVGEAMEKAEYLKPNVTYDDFAIIVNQVLGEE